MQKKNENIKRLFFGMDVKAPWPDELPQGKVILEPYRHMTVAFLGNADLDLLLKKLEFVPQPAYKVGLTGFFQQSLFLPKRHPHVVSWEVEWIDDRTPFNLFYHQIIAWLDAQGFPTDKKHAEFLPHVTLCRSPFNLNEWKSVFARLPMTMTNFNLYESFGNSIYEVRWSFPLIAPFKEIEHTADISFEIFGESFEQLYHHAVTALAFRFPNVLQFYSPVNKAANLDDVIIALNQLITAIDSEIDCPFKAVSFHDTLSNEDGVLKWEMIVDV